MSSAMTCRLSARDGWLRAEVDGSARPKLDRSTLTSPASLPRASAFRLARMPCCLSACVARMAFVTRSRVERGARLRQATRRAPLHDLCPRGSPPRKARLPARLALEAGGKAGVQLTSDDHRPLPRLTSTMLQLRPPARLVVILHTALPRPGCFDWFARPRPYPRLRAWDSLRSPPVATSVARLGPPRRTRTTTTTTTTTTTNDGDDPASTALQNLPAGTPYDGRSVASFVALPVTLKPTVFSLA